MAIDDTLNIQLDKNIGDVVSLFWRPQDRSTIKSFKLYIDTVHTGAFATLVKEIPNIPGDQFSTKNGVIPCLLSRAALTLTPQDPIYLIITTLTYADVESTKTDSPVRLIFPSDPGLDPIFSEIAVSDIPQTFSLNFPVSSLWLDNIGGNEVHVFTGREVITVSSASTFPTSRRIITQVLKVYCSNGETTTLRVAGGYLS